MSLKSVDEIQEEFWDTDAVSPSSIQDLKNHIQNDSDPHMAIIVATDAGLVSLAPYIAKHLDHEDAFIRERTVGCLIGRLFQSQYAEKGFEMAKNDPSDGVRDLAISSLGVVLDELDKLLQQEIADHIYKVLTSASYDRLHKKTAYRSVVDAMDIPLEKRPHISRNFNIEELVDKDLLISFCKKYNVAMTS